MTHPGGNPGYERPGLAYDDLPPLSAGSQSPGGAPPAAPASQPVSLDAAVLRVNGTTPAGIGRPGARPEPRGWPVLARLGLPQTTAARRLAGVAAASLALSVVLTVLLVVTSGGLHSTRQTAAERQTALSSTSKRLDSAERDRDQARADLARTTTDLTSAKTRATELARQRQIIVQCMQLLNQASAASLKNDSKAERARLTEARPICDEASKYLG